MSDSGSPESRKAARVPPRQPDPFLQLLGDRLRHLRAARGMSRKALAKDAEVSERFLADLETGLGNASILTLHRLASALALPLEELLASTPEPGTELRLCTQLLSRLDPARLVEARQLLQAQFGGGSEIDLRLSRIALIGLRGAGKSTLGPQLAKALGYRFVELDQKIEELSGMNTAQIHNLLGQSAYRRYEFNALRELVEQAASGVVIATPGSLVSEAETFGFLLTRCYTVWLKALPEEHMSRVVAQGDMRPMAGNRDAMDDLRRILAAREPLYAKADLTVDTAGRSVDSALGSLLRGVEQRCGIGD